MGMTASVQKKKGALCATIVDELLAVCEDYRQRASQKLRDNNRQTREDLDGEFDPEARTTIVQNGDANNLAHINGLESVRALEQFLLEEKELWSSKLYSVKTDKGKFAIIVHPPTIYGMAVTATSITDELRAVAQKTGFNQLLLYPEDTGKGEVLRSRQVGDKVRIWDLDGNEVKGEISYVH